MGVHGRKLVVEALPLLTCHAALALVHDLGRRPLLTFLVMTAAFAAYFRAARRLERQVSGLGILMIAAGLRLLLLPLPPTLSDDMLRYAWDGKLVLAGFNPYLHAPDSDELSELRDEVWQRMPHRHVPTVYPPVALAVFSAAAALPAPFLGLKILLCFAELLGCWLLIRLARRLDLPDGRALWYCWNPLVVLEVAGMGHVDALVVAAILAAVLALSGAPPRRLAAGAAAAAAGVLSKLVPLVALPMWARQSGRPIRYLAIAGAVTGLALAPVLISTGGVPPGLVTYGVSWEFNGPLYEPLKWFFDEIPAVETLKGTLDNLKSWTGHHDFWNRFYPYVYPELLAKLVLAGIFAGFFLFSLWERHPVIGSGRLFGAVLLCAATVYPWYLLWVLPWAALAKHRAWLALSGLIQLSYLPQITEIPLLPWVYLAIWGPFFVLWARTRWTIPGQPNAGRPIE